MAAIVFLTLLFARNAGFWRYLAGHPSALGLATLSGLLTAVAALLYAFIFLLGARSLGALLQKKITPGVRAAGALDQLLALALGFGVVASAWFFIGLLGLIGKPAALVFLAAMAAAGWLGRKDLPRPKRPCVRLSKLEGAALGLCAFAAFHGLVQAVVPQTAWDVLAYHLAIPKLYLRWGAVREIPWLLHSHAPHLPQTLFAAPLALGFETGAAGFQLFATAALVGLTYGAGAKYFGRREGTLAAAVLLCQPVVYQYAGLAHSDGIYAFFHFAAALSLWRWQQEHQKGWLITAGLLSGFCAASKLFGIALTAALALWIFRKDKKAALRFCVAAALTVGPWFLKTWIATGNPIWPWFFGGQFGAEIVDSNFIQTQAATLSSLPMDLWRNGAFFLLFPALVLVTLRARLSPLTKFLLWPAVPYALVFVLAPSTGVWRYFYPLYPAFALLIAESVKGLKLRRWVVVVPLAVALLPAAFAGQNNQLFAALSLKSQTRPNVDPRRLYLERSLDYYAFYSSVNSLLGPKAKVLLFREIRGYHLEVPYVWGDPVNQGLINYAAMTSGRALLARLKELKITHVLINRESVVYGIGTSYYTQEHQRLMDEALRAGGQPLIGTEGFLLYSL